MSISESSKREKESTTNMDMSPALHQSSPDNERELPLSMGEIRSPTTSSRGNENRNPHLLTEIIEEEHKVVSPSNEPEPESHRF